MDSVLEGATVLSICKLVCSLPFLRSVVTSSTSPISFCCYCLLVFTDVILTVFFSCLLILERWQIVASFTGDSITLGCLLFICHTYGAVFVLTFPEIIVDTLIRHLHQQDTNKQQNCKQNNAAESSDKNDKRSILQYHIAAYFCCLSIWIFGTLNIRFKQNLEEIWTAACLYSTKSLLTCLPNIVSPMMRVLPPCWAMALLFFAIAVAICTFLQCKTPKETATPDADTSETQNTCTIQMCGKSDVGLSPEYTVKNTEHKDHNSTEKVIRLTLPEETKAQSGSSLGTEVMIGVVCILAMFVLPLHLTVNIHLISVMEKTAERSMKYITMYNYMDTT
ncbi:uncharacterized protein LOC117371562 [Periophthalmus magnuspinnatus]|uniref:uncharacterized protein LOC117371562 n=1 Tax=Periophthalmus magnuspinnatus TaxID=409849 RepID=UPI00145B4EF5|nr:uncharacterized protein LOC117371562 [Periophthalmus magnuspinnatus]